MKLVVVYFLLFILGTISVLPTIWGDFIFDDGEAIVKNYDVIGDSSLLQIFQHDFWGVEITHPNSHKSYRPLTILSFKLDYVLWGKNPFPFHVLNWLLHGVNCVLVYMFLHKCNCPGRKRKIEYDALTFWASVIFSVHPVHVEPLGGLVGRADLISSFIFLSTFILYSNQNTPGAIVLVTLAAILGSLFKENAIVLLPFYIAFNVTTKKALNIVLSDLRNYFIALIVLSLFVLIRIWVQGGPPVFQPFDNLAMFADNYFSKISTVLYVWVLNLWILVCPIWLCYDWSMGCMSVITSPLEFRFIITCVLVIVGLRFMYLSMNCSNIRNSILLYSITFFPSSNLLFTVGFVLAERNLYLPSIGFSLLLSHLILKTKKESWWIVGVIVSLFALRSVQRSLEWTSQNSLFISGLDVCPSNAKIHYNLGTMFGESGNVGDAIKSYKIALDLRPDYYQAMNNLGNILRASGNSEEAETWLRRSLVIKDDFAAAWMNLGIVLSKKNATEAKHCYMMALKFRRYYPDCEYNLGNLFLDMGENDLALKAWMKTVALKSTHSQAWINILIILEQSGKLKEAKEWGIRAAKILTEDDTLQFLLGNILGKLEDFDNARVHFENSIKLCTRNNKTVPSKYWSNLGVLYHRWGKKEAAISCYQEALKIDPNLDSAQKNIRILSI